MSTGERFLLGVAVLAALMAVVTATQGRRLAFAAFTLNTVGFVVD